ncbi:hypothetical protein [Roseomonas chloroacetimidivorans]|uniref:hypothetical protein n=1 Tax=Roseomonas chloroacetimidivorans TaxID=1766656 RepID=UPI003C72DEA7
MTTVEMLDPGAPAADPKPAGKPGLTYVTDTRGRRIGVRKIGPLEKMRLFKAIGPVNSRNEQYAGLAMLAYSVAEIDGELVPGFTTELQCEAMVQRLGDEGFDALGEAQLAMMGVTPADVEAAEGDLAAALRLATQRRTSETQAAAKN